MIAIIAATDRNNALGFENRLLFHISADLKRFKALTTGHTVVMGRRTFESLPKGALPNRRNIVLSRNRDFTAAGAEVFASLSEAMEHCGKDEEVFIIGGESVYRQAMDMADRLYMTEIDAAAGRADAYFPAIDSDVWEVEKKEMHPSDGKDAMDYCFTDYVRKGSMV